MTRSVWKGPFVDGYLIKKVQKVLESGKFAVIKTWSRRSTILPLFVGMTFSVHDGKRFVKIVITEEMVGKKLGAFVPTRTFRGHVGSKKVVKK
ncbi:MAG: 30S ribosomal protein S19 [Rickettsiaceae bacterium]